VVKQYEDRLDEIWDAIETLGIDDIKDYVFSSHHPSADSSPNNVTKASPSGYGRMRDFTALVTATVIQALPVLANLRILLETWSIRLTVLRQIPDLLLNLDQVKYGLAAINEVIHDDQKSRKLTAGELETGKVMFGNRVSNLGKRVDKLLDMLEGQQDSLPQAWIDSLEDIESKYAEWVAQAEQVVLRNQVATQEDTNPNSPQPTPVIQEPRPDTMSIVNPTSNALPKGGSLVSRLSRNMLAETTASEAHTDISPRKSFGSIKRKPLLETNSKADQGHRRGISEVSAVGSTFSAYSENAEIVDAHEVPVLPSPRISIIDNPFSSNKTVVSWMGNSNPELSPPRPGLLQRASTASIEVVPRDSLKEVTLRRSASHDLLSFITGSSTGNPRARALHHLIAGGSGSSTSQRGIDDPSLSLKPSGFHDSLTPLAVSPSPSLRVDPLSIRGKQMAIYELDSRPSIPRKSSKRMSLPITRMPFRPLTPPPPDPVDSKQADQEPQPVAPTTEMPNAHKEETFDDRLRSILASMPTKIKLTENSDSASTTSSGSEPSTRASSPGQTLKLSPVKDSKSGSNTTTAGIRVYHLSKTGKSRETPPIKLFVRAVGENGERVMVRVGGGWADLAEYLREYSLHTGGRGLSDKSLEVANLPDKQQRPRSQGSSLSSTIPARDATGLNVPAKSNIVDQEFDFGLTDNSMTRATEEGVMDTAGTNFEQLPGNQWSTPDVHAIPDYDSQYSSRGSSVNNRIQPGTTTPTDPARLRNRTSLNTFPKPSSTTTTTISSSPGTNTYTPLGAAGPVHNGRRVGPNNFNRGQVQPNQVWGDGVANQGRVVASNQTYTMSPPRTSAPTNVTTSITNARTNGTSQVYQNPIITTTTTVMSSRRRAPANFTASPASMSRPVSSMNVYQTPASNSVTPTPTNNTSARPSPITSPDGSRLTQTTSNVSNASYASKNNNISRIDSDRSRKRMSLTDVSGIRRVFLRKKSDKS